MTRRDFFGYLAIILAVTSALGGYWYLNFAPIKLRVAAAPPGSEIKDFFEALAKASDRDQLRVRLTIMSYSNLVEASSAIDAGDVDLAVVRSDFAIPVSGLAVAIMHQNVAVLAACPIPPPSRAKSNTSAQGRAPRAIQRLSDLRGRRVAVFGQGPANRVLFERIASYDGLGAQDAEIIALQNVEEFLAAAAAKPIDAIFTSGPRGAASVASSVRALKCPGLRDLTIVPLQESNVLATRNKVFSAVELVAGEYGSNPPLPPEPVTTLSFPSLLVARKTLSSDVVEEFAKQMFILRQSMIAQQPSAGRIEPLPTDRGSAFTLHPGAAAYYDAEGQSFFQRHETEIYIILFGFGGIASAAIWMLQYLFPKRQQMLRSDHHRLGILVERARLAATRDDLNEIEHEADKLIEDLSARMLNGTADMELKPAFDMMSERLLAVIAERRQEI
jgi:TRAP transporter TAXI family solute receptor